MHEDMFSHKNFGVETDYTCCTQTLYNDASSWCTTSSAIFHDHKYSLYHPICKIELMKCMCWFKYN